MSPGEGDLHTGALLAGGRQHGADRPAGVGSPPQVRQKGEQTFTSGDSIACYDCPAYRTCS